MLPQDCWILSGLLYYMPASYCLKLYHSWPNHLHIVGHFGCVQTSVFMHLNDLNAAKEIHAYLLKQSKNVSHYTLKNTHTHLWSSYYVKIIVISPGRNNKKSKLWALPSRILLFRCWTFRLIFLPMPSRNVNVLFWVRIHLTSEFHT